MANRILISAPRTAPPRPRVRAFCRACLAELGLQRSELSVLLCDDARIRELNREYRGLDRATDVLAFSMLEGESPDRGEMLGDVVVSLERCAAQARRLGLPEHQELARLLAHGICHLLGLDHARGGARARRMFAQQERLVELYADLLGGEG